MTKWKHPIPGFIPGKHCTDVKHHASGTLAPLPSPLHRGIDGRVLYVCDECIAHTLAWMRRSEAAKRGAATRRKQRKEAK
jgi:hypothetical protein